MFDRKQVYDTDGTVLGLILKNSLMSESHKWL